MPDSSNLALGWSVRKATGSDVDEMARTLARAFYGDAVWKWFMPDDATRARRLERMFATFARRVYLHHGSDCYTTNAYDGAALWATPGHEHMSARDIFRILPGWTKAIGWRELLRAKRGVDSLDKVHPHERHYYLPFVGVAPESQGKGLGTALMKPVLEMCDRERVPAYLEATSVGSQRCYQRVGFETRSEEHVAGDGPPFFAMWREPAD
jgi:ribosomal protein S18 acetylase RimI-like enzyme